MWYGESFKLKIYYLFMLADGRCSDGENDKFDKICQTMKADDKDKQEVIDYCNKENFPLFTLPWSVYIIDITYDFCRRIIENEKIETTAAEAFKNIILSPEQGKKYYSFWSSTDSAKTACTEYLR